MCAKDDLVGRKGPLLTSTQTWEVLSNYVDTFGLDFAFLFAAWLQRIKCTLGDVDSLFADNILSLIAFIISYRLFADELVYALRDVAAWLVYVIIGNLTTILACTVEHCCLLSNTALENAAKSGILLACADGRTRQCYLTICAILADYEEQVLLTGVKKNRYCMRCTLQQERCLDKGHDDFVYLVDCFGWKHYNFNIYVSLATDTLHLLLKDMLDDIYPGSRKTWDNSTTLVTQESGKQKVIIQQLVAVVSLLFVLKAPFALHFIRAVCDLVILAQYKMYRRTLGEEKNFNYPKWHALTYIIQDIRMYGALDGICTGANSEAHYITMVKQFYSMINKKEYILVTRPLPFRRLGWLILGIQPYSTKLLLSEVAVNIAISNFIYAAAVFIHPSIKCWRSSGKRHNDPEHCDEEVVRCAPNWQQIGLWRRDYVWLYLILIIIDYTCYDKDGKHMAYIGAFSEVLLFNNNGQIDNTTGMLSVRRRAWNAALKRWILQAFKFYDLSTIICLVHLVPRDLPDLITRTTMSYYVNNYIDWDEYNCLYLLIFDIDLLRMLREY
ncbi:hypothetical protein HBI39_209020 [Parastagonospora nodorum]|nr:hypothetical protein HBI39_209020 [Parastagonospora nodorum]